MATSGLQFDRRGVAPTDRDSAAAHLELERITERRDLEQGDRRAGDEAKLHQPAPKCALSAHPGHGPALVRSEVCHGRRAHAASD